MQLAFIPFLVASAVLLQSVHASSPWPHSPLVNSTHRSLLVVSDDFLKIPHPAGDLYAMFPGKLKADSTASKTISTAIADCDKTCCINTCFAHALCNYFAAKPAKKGSKPSCQMYKHLVLKDDPKGVNEYGYIKAAPPGKLSHHIPCATRHETGSVQGFCKDGTDVSFYFPYKASDATGMCAVDKMTLFRAAQVQYYTGIQVANSKAMVDALKGGLLFNANELAPDTVGGGEFSLKTYLALTRSPGTPLSISVKHVNVAADKKVSYKTPAGTTTFNYKLDAYGRVATVSATMTASSLLKEEDTGDTNRDGYCDHRFQDQFNDLRPLAAEANKIEAGHVVGCQFTNPNGFWNFVVQNKASNAGGCWYYSERAIGDLLAKGCKGKFLATMTYFDSVTAHSSFAGHPTLFPQADVTKHYVTKPGNDEDYKCSFFHRPHTMSLTFELQEPADDTSCDAVWHVLKDETDKKQAFFKVNGDTIEITRAFALWALESVSGSTKKYVNLKGLATNAAGRCFNEPGKQLTGIQVSNDFDRVHLYVPIPASADAPGVVKPAGAKRKAEDIECLETGTDGAISVVPCASKKTAQMFTLDTDAKLSPQICEDAAKKTGCATFVYDKPKITQNADHDVVATAEDLELGKLIAGKKCVQITDDKKVTFVPADGGGCTEVRAAYANEHEESKGAKTSKA